MHNYDCGRLSNSSQSVYCQMADLNRWSSCRWLIDQWFMKHIRRWDFDLYISMIKPAPAHNTTHFAIHCHTIWFTHTCVKPTVCMFYVDSRVVETVFTCELTNESTSMRLRYIRLCCSHVAAFLSYKFLSLSRWTTYITYNARVWM